MNKLKDYFIFTESNLPVDGWLQGCFTCGQITGDYYKEDLVRYYYSKYQIKVYICHKCKDKLEQDDDFYKNYIYHYDKSIKKIFR